MGAFGVAALNPVLALALVALLIVVNGLFVAAEFALIAVRRGTLEARAADGDGRARVALAELDRASFMLSGVQFGITATSLVVGFLAEPAIGDALVRPVLAAVGLGEAAAAPIAVTVALVVSTVAQMLFGELAPKNLALARPVRTSLLVARPIHLFGMVLGPVIRLFDGAATWVTRRVFRVEPPEERRSGHSPEELARIIVASQEEGQLSDDQGALLTRAVELGERRVAEIMVPRPRVVFLRGDETLLALRAAARESGHSRFPVVGETEDDVLGTIHVKDILRIPEHERETASVGSLADRALVVPDSDRLRALLSKFRAARRTFAVVADEYGGVAGIVTVEDVLEELVGEIQDEFDRESGPIRPLQDGSWSFDGTVRVDQAAETLRTRLPEGDYETIAGLVIAALERIPERGDAVDVAGWRLTAVDVEGLRVERVTARKLEEAG